MEAPSAPPAALKITKTTRHDRQYENEKGSQSLRSVQVAHELAHDFLGAGIGVGGERLVHLLLHGGAEFLAVGGKAQHVQMVVAT